MPRPRKQDQVLESVDLRCDDGIIHLDAVQEARAGLATGGRLADLANLFAALGDPTRLRIVAALADHELCVCDLAAAVGHSESAVSHHLRLLRTLGLVRSRREGRLVYYALDDGHVVALYRQALDHVDHRISGGAA